MSSFNKVLLMGNLTRDPASKQLAGGSSVTEFGIACNRKWKTPQGEEREEVAFIDVAAFGKTGELINQYFTKGKPIFIEGRLKYDQWEDKQGGGKRSKLSIVCESFQFIGGRDDAAAEDAPARSTQRPATRAPSPSGRPASQRPPAEKPFGDEQQFKNDDIPFRWSGRDGQPI